MGQILKMQKPLDQLVIEIREHVFDAGKAETTCAKHQLQAGWRLLALRERVDAGEAGAITWWEYFDTQFTGHIKSRRYAEKLMQWAKTDDPEGAITAERERVRAAVKEHREKERVLRNTENEVRPWESTRSNRSEEYDIVSHALSLVGKMDETQLEDFHQQYMEKFQ